MEKVPLNITERRKWYREKQRERQRMAVKKCRIKHNQKQKEDQEKLDNKRKLNAERAKKYRQRKKQIVNEKRQIPSEEPIVFKNRMQKCRAIKAAKDSLRAYTPIARAEILKGIIDSSSPKSKSTRRCLEFNEVVQCKELINRNRTANAVLTDITHSLKETNRSNERSSSTVHTKNAVTLITGQSIEKNKLKASLSRETGLDRRLINKCLQRNKELCEGKEINSIWTVRKPRSDKITDDVKEKIREMWIENSQPINDKKKVIKNQVSDNCYTENIKHILTSTQFNIYKKFLAENPGVNIGQRTFESCRPFFIKPASRKDRVTCLCKQHVEMNALFKSARSLRKEANDKYGQENRVWEDLNDFVAETLCEPIDIDVTGEKLHSISCLNRSCDKCGPEKLNLTAAEISDSETIKWQKYEYASTGKKDRRGREIRKNNWISVTTSYEKFWDYIKTSLSSFPLHSFQATWQRDQLKKITSNLPKNEIVVIHDYAEDFACELQDEIQSEYFGRNEIAIHVSVLFRHKTCHDGEDDNNIIKEYVFCILEDNSHDRDTVHHVRKTIIDYLKNDLDYELKFIHEFSDGCSSQYKSRFCMKDVSQSFHDFECETQRNFFETSHGKGEQDAAGSHIKNKVRMSTIRRECTVQNAMDFYTFLKSSFQFPSSSSFKSRQENVKLKRRLFFYISADDVVKNRSTLDVRPVKNNRKIHSIRSTSDKPGQLLTRRQSCYCIMCIQQQYENCHYKHVIGKWDIVKI